MMYETILSPIHYGGMQLKNRIIFAPTTFGLSDEEYLAKIRAIAQGGCAMIIVGDVPPFLCPSNPKRLMMMA